MKIGIIGLGLIGGSLALDWRSLGHTILGVSRRAETCEQAIARGVVDDASPDLALMATAEVVVLCTPLGAMAATVAALLPHLQSGAILTDVGSVKQPIVEAIAPRWPHFVGGHPMAGTAESGLDAAQRHLFVDRPYILTPVTPTLPADVETVAELVRSLQAQLYFCQPTEHDRAVALISHLPVMVSASLINACLAEPDAAVLQLAQHLASSGFADTSRVGGGNPELGVMMAKYNQTALLHGLYQYRDRLDQIIHQVETQDWAGLEALLHQTQQARPEFLK
ncbi:MAG: prephenate/arogenate dehydrogenase [Elainellaceae cyanobacterium]